MVCARELTLLACVVMMLITGWTGARGSLNGDAVTSLAGNITELIDDGGCGTHVTANVPNTCLPRTPGSTDGAAATRNGTANDGCLVELMLNRATSVKEGNAVAAGRHAAVCPGDF